MLNIQPSCTPWTCMDCRSEMPYPLASYVVQLVGSLCGSVSGKPYQDMRRKGGQAVQFRQSGSLMVVLYSVFFQMLHQALWFPVPAHFHSNILELSVPYASSWYRLKIKFFYIHSFVFAICGVFFGYFMCQLDWAMRCPDIWSNSILGVSYLGWD